MASETTNHKKLIATEKTDHVAISVEAADILKTKQGKLIPGSNWDGMKKLRKAGAGTNTQNTFIDGATIFIQSGRIDEKTQSNHTSEGLGFRSAAFRGDIVGQFGSRDVVKEGKQVMRTGDVTFHNCLHPTGEANCTGTLHAEDTATALVAKLRGQLSKLCQIVEFKGKCSHGRNVPSDEHSCSFFEVVKSGNAQRADGELDAERRQDPEAARRGHPKKEGVSERDEVLSFEVVRKNTSTSPVSPSLCQVGGKKKHTHWKALYGDKLLKEATDVDKFEVTVPGFAPPSITGLLPAIKWLLDTKNGPKQLTVTATSCGSSRTSLIQCYPNGKVAVDFTTERLKFEKVFDAIRTAALGIQYIGMVLNGGSMGKDTKFELMPAGSEFTFECEFKERKDHRVGAEWKATFGFNPLVLLDFKWPIPLSTFMGPFMAAGRMAEKVIEWLGFSAAVTWGAKFELLAAGVIECNKDDEYSGGIDSEVKLTLYAGVTLTRTKGAATFKLVMEFTIEGSMKLKLRPITNSKGFVSGALSGVVQVGFLIKHEDKGAVTKLFEAKPEWARFPRTEGSQSIGQPFTIL